MFVLLDAFLALDQWVAREMRYALLYEGLITEYLVKSASERFFELAQKYALDLEQFA